MSFDAPRPGDPMQPGSGSGSPPAEEPRGRDRFPGGAAPLLGTRQRRWAGRAGEFIWNLVFFGVVTTLLTSWLSNEPGTADDFTLFGVLFRGTLFALVMLAASLWKDRKKRRTQEADPIRDRETPESGTRADQ